MITFLNYHYNFHFFRIVIHFKSLVVRGMRVGVWGRGTGLSNFILKIAPNSNTHQLACHDAFEEPLPLKSTPDSWKHPEKRNWSTNFDITK